MRVLVPLDSAPGLLGSIPDGVSVEVWDGLDDPPGGGADVAMWVPWFAIRDHAEVARRLPDLRVVQLLTAGYEHVSLPPAITVCNAGSVHDGAVAEWAVAAILAMVRELPAWVRDQPRGALAPFESGTLAGATVLVLGHGGIGRAIERRLAGFEVTVLAVGSRPRPGVHGVGELAQLLPRADVVVLAVPLTDATQGLVDAAFLSAMPDDGLLVNAARGAIVDHDALASELLTGRLRAALDVSEPEPLPADSPLRALPNLLYTPHVAGATDTIFPRVFALVGEQIRRLAAGEPLAHVVSAGGDDPVALRAG